MIVVVLVPFPGTGFGSASASARLTRGTGVTGVTVRPKSRIAWKERLAQPGPSKSVLDGYP
jgi:hypothetical protein